MILKGILYIVLIIFSAVFLIVSLVMTAMKFSSNGKQAGRWFMGFGVGLVVLIFSIVMLVRGIAGKAKEFVGNIEEFGKEQAHRMDSLNNMYTNSKDSLLESASVNYLMSLEPDSIKGRVPVQFYGYLGFRDYYRLPIVWPYSLHCMDSLGDGSLFNEASVQQFDINDNGELSCDINRIAAFAFTKEHLIGLRTKPESEPKKIYFAYDFASKSERTFKTKQDLLNYAAGKGFNKDAELKSCRDYYNEF